MDTHKNRLAEAILTSTHNLCFEQEYKKYQNFLSEIFSFLEVIFFIYLNRLVFGMRIKGSRYTFKRNNIVKRFCFVFAQF